MDFRVNVRGFDGVKAELNRISDSLKRGQATQMALNKVADKGRAEVVRAVTERFAIKADLVRSSIVLRRAARTNAGMTAAINIFGSPTKRGRSMNMVRFLAAIQQQRLRGTRAKKKELQALAEQLGFQILKGGGLKQIPGAFIGNKGRTIFMREGNARLPIKPVQVIGVSQMFSTKVIARRVMAKIDAELLTEVQRAVKVILERGA